METVDDLMDTTQHSCLKYSIYIFQIIGSNILIPVEDNILENSDDRSIIIDINNDDTSKKTYAFHSVFMLNILYDVTKYYNNY